MDQCRPGQWRHGARRHGEASARVNTCAATGRQVVIPHVTGAEESPAPPELDLEQQQCPQRRAGGEGEGRVSGNAMRLEDMGATHRRAMATSAKGGSRSRLHGCLRCSLRRLAVLPCGSPRESTSARPWPFPGVRDDPSAADAEPRVAPDQLGISCCSRRVGSETGGAAGRRQRMGQRGIVASPPPRTWARTPARVFVLLAVALGLGVAHGHRHRQRLALGLHPRHRAAERGRSAAHVAGASVSGSLVQLLGGRQGHE